MAGQPRRRRARMLVQAMVAVLRESGQAWTAEELLDRLGHGPAYHAKMTGWQRAGARMALRDVRKHPRVIVDSSDRLHYWSRGETNGRLLCSHEDGDAA